MKIFPLIFTMIVSNSLNAQTTKNEIRNILENLNRENVIIFPVDNSTNGADNSTVFIETTPLGYDLFAANLTFIDKDQIQKIGFSPIKLINKYYPVLTNLRLNIVNNNGALTTGISVGNDNSIFQTKRVQSIYTKIYTKTPDNDLPNARARDTNETILHYMNYYKTDTTMQSFQDKLLNKFDEQRLKHVFKWSIGYNAQFFNILKSKSQNGNFDSLNYYAFKGHNLFGKVSYSFKNGLINLSSAYNYFNKRKSADSVQQKRQYNGYSFGGSVRAITLLKHNKLITKDFYKKTLFIPGIYFGINYDKQNYRGNEPQFAEDKLKWKSIITFSTDISISPISQFRLSFPIQQSKEFNSLGKGSNLISVFQYTFKFIDLAN